MYHFLVLVKYALFPRTTLYISESYFDCYFSEALLVEVNHSPHQSTILRCFNEALLVEVNHSSHQSTILRCFSEALLVEANHSSHQSTILRCFSEAVSRPHTPLPRADRHALLSARCGQHVSGQLPGGLHFEHRHRHRHVRAEREHRSVGQHARMHR